MIHGKTSYPGVPQRLFEGIKSFACDGLMPGDFLTAVLCNDLFEAFGRADPESAASMPAIAMLIYNELPSNIWRTRERMLEWCKECDARRQVDADQQDDMDEIDMDEQTEADMEKYGDAE